MAFVSYEYQIWNLARQIPQLDEMYANLQQSDIDYSTIYLMYHSLHETEGFDDFMCKLVHTPEKFKPVWDRFCEYMFWYHKCQDGHWKYKTDSYLDKLKSLY